MLKYLIAYSWYAPGAGPETSNVQSVFVEAAGPKEALAKARRQLQADWQGDPVWELETMIVAAFGDRKEIAALAQKGTPWCGSGCSE